MADPRVAPEDLGHLLVGSVRYALGRRSYIVGMTTDWVRRYWPHVEPKWREILIRDVREDFDRAWRLSEPKLLGDDCDVASWWALLLWMEANRG